MGAARSMRAFTRTRKLHRWLNTVIGIQLLIWALSGFYMVVVNLDFIRGNHLVKNLHEPLPQLTEELVPVQKLLLDFDAVRSVSLKSVLDHPYYIVKSKTGSALIDARSGVRRSPIDQSMAIRLARHYYNGEAAPATAVLISQDPPGELYARPLPLWRINFADRIRTSFYIDPHSAELVTRRHDFWRVFDFFWMLHIMDYDERTHIGNPVLRLAAGLGLMSVMSGAVLLFFRLRHRRR